VAIVDAVKTARQEGRDWYVFELAGLLDRLAWRRYLESPAARPSWWTKYELPPELKALDPVPNSRFFTVEDGKRSEGGLFSLDGVHPTTVAYGVIALELCRIMELAKVRFLYPNGTPRDSPISVDFRNLIAHDTLISDPPGSLTSDLDLIGWFDQKLDVFSRLM
jgi:hypothetical protein